MPFPKKIDPRQIKRQLDHIARLKRRLIAFGHAEGWFDHFSAEDYVGYVQQVESVLYEEDGGLLESFASQPGLSTKDSISCSCGWRSPG